MLTKSLISRAILLRTLKNATANIKQTQRNAGHGAWSYRVPPPLPSKRSVLLAEVLGGVAWWWIIWHLLTEPEHVYGHWPYVDPSTWSDEELGIPPVSAGPLKK